ncbi:B3 domain-containing protein At3g25182 [Eutrema salsugineum]|uniref:B3 domain-containing protein At3g25182 n=1 Tax=Eutrema salsugineum TaxID=72664 RepID=UPI000CED1778|nr:B3 domain-containing protein At3g25182 [Eutrema salsugineum]
MYYNDHRARAKKDVTSRNSLSLTKKKTKTKTKTETDLSAKEETEEERDRRIFHLFPKKNRNSGVNSQQNLNGASSSSSSILLDHNTIPADSETRNPQNPNGPSPSSSSSFLFDLNTISADDSETQNPQNPNSQLSLSLSLTENKSPKKRAAQDISPSGKSKKAKVATFSWIGKEIPERLTQLMTDKSEAVLKLGERTDLKLIFEKTLFNEDVDSTENYLSMPSRKLIHKDFLKPFELRIVKKDINNDDYKFGIEGILFDERNVKWEAILQKFEVEKESGRRSWNYNLTCGWNEIVKANGLKQGDNISVWSFRWGALLCFALVTPPPSLDLSL